MEMKEETWDFDKSTKKSENRKASWNALFTGQGSNRVDMFDPFLDNQEWIEHIGQASSILNYDLLEIMHDENKISETSYAQPLNFVYEYMLYQQYMKQVEKKPQVMIGHSMGEFVALACSGAVDFEQGVRIMDCRGRLMSQVDSSYTMVALMGVDAQEVEFIMERYNAGTKENAAISNYNGRLQTIITVKQEDLDSFRSFVQNENKQVIMKVIGVQYPFHTTHMKKFALQFREYLNGISFQKMQIPIVSNVNGKVLTDRNIKRYLFEQMYMPVRFTECIHYANLLTTDYWVEFGPKPVLGKIVGREYPDQVTYLASNLLLGRMNAMGNEENSVSTSMKEKIAYYLKCITTIPSKGENINYQKITKNYEILKKVYSAANSVNFGTQQSYIEQVFIETMNLKGYN